MNANRWRMVSLLLCEQKNPRADIIRAGTQTSNP